MTGTVEVFSDVTCPFAHVGFERIVAELAAHHAVADVHMRAWPLEWVNGVPLDHDAVGAKAATLTARLGIDSFGGLDAGAWPTTTIPALELTAAANEVDLTTGLAVGLAIRAALFRFGRDISDPDVLAEIAAAHDVEPGSASADAVHRDYAEGKRRGVRGSPHYWAGDDEFFCPALVIGHDEEVGLTADFNPVGLSSFLDGVTGSFE